LVYQQLSLQNGLISTEHIKHKIMLTSIIGANIN